MGPKSGLTQEQKLANILGYFHSSRTCHTLKDLENALPTAAKINKMNVKDFLKELMDDNKVRMEKIGSNNWYWAWFGEECTEKRKLILQLEAELAKQQETISELRTRLNQLQANRTKLSESTSHQELLLQRDPLRDEVNNLIADTKSLESCAAKELDQLSAESEILKQETTNLTDTIYMLDDHINRAFRGDKESLESIRRESYGPCWVEGEGLCDIEDL